MTARQVYEGVLIEMNKVQAPSLLLEDFNYLFNKAINQYVNKIYNRYDISQQTTDDLRVLKSSCILNANTNNLFNDVTVKNSMWGAIYEFELPQDYLHLLSCICNYKVRKPFKCYDAGTYVQFPATRLTADMWSQVINNFYMRPMYKRPYYYINNINHDKSNAYLTQNQSDDGKTTYTFGYGGYQGGPMLWEKEDEEKNYKFTEESAKCTEDDRYSSSIPSSQVNLPTDPREFGGVDAYGVSGLVDCAEAPTPIEDSFGNQYMDQNSVQGAFPRTIKIGEKGDPYNGVERVGQLRYGNPSTVRLEIRYGKDNSLFTLDSVYVDYLKAPQYIRLTQEQLDLTEDTSQIMEFPDYVCQEIINELVHIVMENSSDPRLNTHIPVSQSIANPAQAQDPAQQPQQQARRAQ